MISSPEIVANRSANILCCYRNSTSQLQIARISDQESRLAERVVFPGEQWLFEASPEAYLHIHGKDGRGDSWVATRSCDHYQVKTPTET